MFKKFLIFNYSFLIILWGCSSQKSVVSNPEKLVWSDEFNYNGLPDSTKWTFEEGGHGWGNNEAQFYTKNRVENARVENGNLIIEARKEDWQDKKYTSARLITQGKGDWKYGKVEVRAKIPKGRGSWPAIWMLASNMKQWPDDGELDIMEHVGYNQGFIHASIHTKKYNHMIGTQKTDTIFVKDCSDKFHVYTAEWDKDKIEVYVDDIKYFTVKNTEKTYEAWPFDNPLFLILNIAVGGNWGGQKGIDDTIFPLKMEIDYVRVYSNSN